MSACNLLRQPSLIASAASPLSFNELKFYLRKDKKDNSANLTFNQKWVKIVN